MLFWLICALLTVLALVASLRPLLAGPSDQSRSLDPDVQVYKQQLKEVERDVGRGLLGPQEAKSAKLEISRRLLAADSASGSASPETENPPGSMSTDVAFYTISACVVLASVALYMLQGTPGYPSMPFAERARQAPRDVPVNELVARVEARLRAAPGDGQGWEVIAPIYLRQGRFTDAIQAYARAIELLGENRDRLRGFAEAHLNAGGGVVNQEARAAFRKILATEPELVAPRFWLAVGLEQDGDRAAAERAYRSLLQERDGNQPELAPRVRAMIEQRLAAVTGAASSGNQVGEPRPVPDADAGKAPALPGNTATVPASEQAELIEGMVSGLAARLANGGGSVEEWQRLMRAYVVLGRREQAADAWRRAKLEHADLGESTRLDEFAGSLGLAGSAGEEPKDPAAAPPGKAPQ